MCKKKKNYDAGSVTIVSLKGEKQELSSSVVVENANDYDEDYLNMIFGSQEEDC